MARKDDEINEEEENEKPKPKKKSGVLKILAIVFAAFLLIGTSIGATLFLTGVLSKHDEESAVAAEDSADTTAEPAPEAKSKSKKSKGKKGAKEPKAPPIYVELGDPFVVNFVEAAQIRYVQIKIEVMTRDQLVSEAIKTHLPQVRNNLVLMFSGLDYGSLTTADGKQKIRDQALVEIQNILKEETGNTGAEAVYFTSFVMQ
jgi:flagellar protein FliL